jgi:hypothetical protein
MKTHQALTQRSWNTLAQKGRCSPNVLGQQWLFVLQSIGKPFWFPIDRRTQIPPFSQPIWETDHIPSSNRFENHSVFKLFGKQQDNMFLERLTPPTVLQVTTHFDLLTAGALESCRICRRLPGGSLHSFAPHWVGKLCREPMWKGV